MYHGSKGSTETSSELPELGSCLSNGDAITLLEIIHNSVSCDSEQEFLRLFPKVQELFPFDFAGVLAGRHQAGNELSIAHGINISFPDEWLREYLAKNYFHLDVVTKETFITCKPQHWSYLTPGADAIVAKEIKTLNMDLGMKECYSHGAHPSGPGRNGSMFCFSGPSIKFDIRTIVILKHIIPHLHLAMSHLSDKKNTESRNIALSSREKEVLSWLNRGKSSWETSVILGISERTVNYHIYNVMEKLDAVNRPQALAVAIRLGLIEAG
jgi:DNA-binding CsgD family transcriptional regulator